MPFQGSRGSVSSLVASAALAVAPQAAGASAPSADLMARLAEYAGRFETARKHCSYDVSGRMVTFDRSGGTDSVKELSGRIEARGQHIQMTVTRYIEDGKDKTGEAQKKAREKAPEGASDRDKKEARMPILAEEQPRYVFEQLEVDRADAARVRISFVPKVPDHDTIEGSIWVDTRSATVLSAGFKLSKTPMFVDYLHFTMEFGAPTTIGPAVSTVVVDGKGGVPFFSKRFHVTATLSDYLIPGP
jgi:hypothetical protein